MGCFLSQLACCCGPDSCNLPIRESTSTRLMYTLFLVFTFTIQCVMQIPSLQIYMDRQAVNISDNYTGFCLTSLPDNACYQMLGYIGVYKVGFAMWAFHILLMLWTYKTESSSDCRATLHNGYWFFKFLILCGLIIGATFIPSYLAFYWFYFGLNCGAAYASQQFHELLKTLTKLNTFFKSFFFSKSSSEKTFLWKIAPIILLLIVYSFAIGAYCLLFSAYWHKNCIFHKVVIGVTLGHCGVIIWAAIFQRFTNKRNVNLGWIQTPAVCVLLAFYAWSTLSSMPSEVEKKTSQYGQNVTTQHSATKTEDCLSKPNSEFLPAYMGVVLTFVLTVKGSLSTSGRFTFSICAKLGKRYPRIIPVVESCMPNSDDEIDSISNALEPRRPIAFCDEAERVLYSYSYFHFISSLAALLLMMHLTGWMRPEYVHLENFNRNFGAVWFKASCITLCAVACKPWPFRVQDDRFRLMTILALCFKRFR